MTYKLMTSEQYYSEDMQVVGQDEEGNDILKSKWELSHPKARFSPDGSEVVLSNAGTTTREEVLEYIKDWNEEE